MPSSRPVPGVSQTLIALVALGTAALPPLARPARADSVEASATTYVTLKREARDGELSTVVPVYELLSLRARDLSNPVLEDTEVVLSLWGRGTGGTPRDDDTFTGDVDVGYIKGTLGHGHLTLRAGRQFIAGGVSRNVQADAVELDAHVAHGFGATAFAGSQVAPRFGMKSGDLLGGGRVYWERGFESAVGVSFIRMLDHKYLARQDIGFDAWQALPHHLDAGAFVMWSLVEERLGEADLSLGWSGWRRRLQITAEAQRTAPDLFLSRASILSVFAEEKHDDVGGSVNLRALPMLRLGGQYHFVRTEAGDGHRATARVVLGVGRPGLANLGLEGRYLDVHDAGYLGGRLYATVRPNEKLALTADVDVYHLLEDVNAQDRSLLVGLTAGYAFWPGWQAMLAGTAGQTPFYQRQFEGTLRVGYAFGGGR